MVLDQSTDQALERAAHRAYARNLTAQLVGVQHVGHEATEFYDVASFSTAGLMHRVRLDYTADGVNAACDCMGGQNGRICQHVAAALEASQSIPAVEPEPAPVPAEPNWLRRLLDEQARERDELYKVAR
jgi:hypothetical protein